MKIAYLCCDAGIPVSGVKGASVHVREVVNALQGLGHEVRVYSPAVDAPDETFRSIALSGIAKEAAAQVALDLPEPEHLANEFTRLLLLEQLKGVLQPEFAQWRPNFIYERYSLFGYAGLELADQLQVPLLLEVNAPLRQEQERYRQLELKQAADAIERRVLTGAGNLLVVSEALAEYAVGLGVEPQNIEVLPNAVDVERFNPNVPLSRLIDKTRADEKLVGFVGSLKLWHDVDTLVEAVRQLHAEDETYRLLIVGDGPRWHDLKALDESFLNLIGAVAHDQVPGLLTAMDVIAVPYAAEGDPYFSPIKLFEAMAVGKPVVGARVGQVAEIIEDGVNGLLYDPGNAADLATKIRLVFGSADRGTGLGQEARLGVERWHTWRHNAERIVGRAEALISSGVRLG